jgi:cytidyltransferase-like protein
MELITAPDSSPSRLGLLPGGFNPPTRAHLALAGSALAFVDAVLLVIPRSFPHKTWEGASPDQRYEMLRRVTAGHPGIGAAIAEGGLFIEIAREARELFPTAELHIICGRDAAERIVSWDYGEAGSIDHMLEEFRLLVAPRQGAYVPPAHLEHAVRTLPVDSYDDCSSTHVRTGAEGWRSLVPHEIAAMVQKIYCSVAVASRNARRR